MNTLKIGNKHETLDSKKDTVGIIPIVNTVFLLVLGVMQAVTSLKIHLPFVKLWNKFKSIKIK